jgi:hypothetical protein
MAVSASTTDSKKAPPRLAPLDSNMLNTLPDPRTPSSASTMSRNDSIVDSNASVTGSAHWNEEIAKLSEKLVNAINHQTSLDDTLQATRHDLDVANQRIETLVKEAAEHDGKIKAGLLFTKQDYEKRETKFSAELQVEKEAKMKAESDKKAMQAEVETLTSALFQEANEMVADARREKEAADKKTEQLRNQLRDTEELLQSQQEQLQDLKAVLERMASEQGDADSITHSSNAPSSPVGPNGDRNSRMFESITPQGHQAKFNPDSSTITAGETVDDSSMMEHSPMPPLHYAHLIQPVLRTDVQSYSEFITVIKAARAATGSPPPSRVASGSYGSFAPILNSALNSPNSNSATVTTPNIPGSFPNGSGSPRPYGAASPPPPSLPVLRETKLFKRALAEEIEPTLRLDIAPGVSWMVRRTVLNAMIDGSLVVEPMPPPPVKFRGPVNQCSLCGENRIGEEYKRRHRFRVSEDKEKKGYPLCDYCLGRFRSCGDLLSFLRMVAGGFWRAEKDEDLRGAWEEFVRLREKMFWCRIAGGVIPAGSHRTEGNGLGVISGRSSEDNKKAEKSDPFTKYGDETIPDLSVRKRSVIESTEMPTI